MPFTFVVVEGGPASPAGVNVTKKKKEIPPTTRKRSRVVDAKLFWKSSSSSIFTR